MEIVKIFFLALLIIAPIRIFLFQPFFVQGASMEPNFEDREYLIVNELGYKITDVGFNNIKFFSIKSFKSLERGDVIVFRYPKNPSQYFIILALKLKVLSAVFPLCHSGKFWSEIILSFRPAEREERMRRKYPES